MKKKIIPLLIIILIGAAGYWYFTQNPEQLVQLQLRFGLISQSEASGVYSVSGFIEAEEIEIAAETKGRIARITVDEGDYVTAGQPLVQLDTDLLDVEMQQARAKIETAKAQLAKIEAGVRAEEIAKAEAAVAVAQANAQAARTQWQDAITLRDNPQELDMQIDAAKTEMQLAELQIEHAIPLKDAGEALWELGRQQYDYVTDEHRFCGTNPFTGEKVCQTVNFPEGKKQDAGVAWNFAGADMWEAWVDLNTAMTKRDNTQAILDDLLRLKNDPQEAQLKVAQAESAYRTARAQVDVAQAQVDILKAGARTEQLAVAQAQVEQSEAALAALRVQRDRHTLSAPLDGWVVERPAHQGEMAAPGAPLLTLADLTNVTLTVYVPEPDVDIVSVGQKVKVFVDSFPNEPFVGTVTFINDEAEFTPKNVQTKEQRVTTVFAVEISIENEAQRLKPGMPADAVLQEKGSSTL